MSDNDPASGPVGSERPAPAPLIEHAPQPEVSTPDAPRVVARRRGGTPLPLTLLLTAGLGGGLYWVWSHPKPGTEPTVAVAAADPQAAIEAAKAQATEAVQAQTAPLVQQIQALAGRVDALEKQPHPADAGAPAVGADALAGLSKKLDDVSGHVDALSAKQNAQEAEIQKMAETAAQKPPEPAAQPVDTTAQQVPALIAGQRAADLGSKLDRSLAEQKSASEQALSQQKTASEQALSEQKAASEQAVSEQKAASEQAVAEQKSALDALTQRLAKLEQAAGQTDQQQQQQRQQQDQTAQQSQAQALAAVDALGQRLAKLEQGAGQAQQQEQQAQTEQQARADKDRADQDSRARAAVDALGARVEKLEKGQGQVQGVAQDASRAIRIEAAQAALQAGQPLGTLPGAPAALARYATAPPPTESGLRAAFPRVAEAARVASQPDVSKRSFLDRALARVQQSVTVRRGDQVIVGDPASGVLARAQDWVNAGDLKSAADTLGSLNGPASAATQDWVAQVHALLDARAALAAMAHG